MAPSTFLPGLTAEIVGEHILPKVLEPILEPYHRGDYGRGCEVRANFFTLICIFKYMGVNKAWREHFGMGEVYNALRMSLWDVDIPMGHRFRGVRGTSELAKLLRAFRLNLFMFSHTQRIAIPIRWEVQHARLNDIWIIELEYLWDKLVENGEYWLQVDGRSAEYRRCTNFWICPSE